MVFRITKVHLELSLLQSLKEISSDQTSIALKVKGTYKLHPSLLQLCFDQACKKGSSSWVSVLPIADLRYDWALINVPQHWNCGKQSSVDHAMTCHLGGFLTVRHNDILRYYCLTADRSVPQCCSTAIPTTS